MQLNVVVVPPPDVLDDVLAAAQRTRLTPKPVEEPPDEPRGGLLQRLSRRGTTQAPQPEVPFGVVPSEERFVRLTRFGNVTSADTESLGIALGIAALDWPAPVVHVSGLAIDITARAPVITAKLGGDTDALRLIFRSILEVAATQRFYLDRRIFHTEFPVATVDIADDTSVRERLDVETESLPGADWQVTHLTLLRLSFGAPQRLFEHVAVVPLGSHAG